MININNINKNKLEAVKGLKSKQIEIALLKLWKKYYNTFILNLNSEKANAYIKQIDFILENANTEELYKIYNNDLMVRIEMITTNIALDLNYKNISLNKGLINSILFTTYQKLSTFNNMFNIIKDNLDNLNEDQSFILANQIVSCRMFILRINQNKDTIKTNNELDNKIYNDYLKEKELVLCLNEED